MKRGRLIVVLACVLFAMQLALIISSRLLLGPSSRPFYFLLDFLCAAIMGIADAATARYLLAATRRVNANYAREAERQLEQAFESYRETAAQEEQLTAEIGRAVESELAHARKALVDGCTAEAEGHLQASLDLASQTRGSGCEYLGVAAVLDAKTRQCDEAGVRLEARVALPAELSLPEIEVASIFFNLIDNALHECQALAEQDGSAEVDSGSPYVIAVQSKVQAGQLFVEVTNPCRKGLKLWHHRAMRRAESAGLHGWGTEIVREIARKHGGIAEFVTGDASFTAKVLIPLEETSRS